LKIKGFQSSERMHKAVNIEVSLYGERGDGMFTAKMWAIKEIDRVNHEML